MANITMRQMLEAGVHFGHKTRYWDPAMGPYIYGIRSQIHIINLDLTYDLFHKALRFVADLAGKRGKILFVGTKSAAREIIQQEGSRCGMPYVNNRWLGGMLTNYKTIRQSIKRLKDSEERLANPDKIAAMTKKEVLNLMREKDKLASNISGIVNMGGLPDALFVIDVNNEKIAIQEANRLGIPVIGVVDTNCNPNGIDYIIPGNDDALRSIRFYCQAIADTIIEIRGEQLIAQGGGVEVIEEMAAKKIVTKKAKFPKKKEAEVAEVNDTENSAKNTPKGKKTALKKDGEAKPRVKESADKAESKKKPKPKQEKTRVAESENTIPVSHGEVGQDE